MKSLVILGRGDDSLLYFNLWLPQSGWAGWKQLPGALAVFGFSATQSGARIDVLAVNYKRAMVQWTSSDGGQIWLGPTDLGGLFTSGPLAFATVS